MSSPHSSGTPADPPDPRDVPPTRSMPATGGLHHQTGGPGEDRTRSAPPFHPILPPVPRPDSQPTDFPRPGERLGDLELVCVLGAGAFARVYLARQRSLGREVALKVSVVHPGDGPPLDADETLSATAGDEARTLAALAHDHIVQVYFETLERSRGLRLLCMQYVPGTTLAQVIQFLADRARATWSGRTILEAVDSLSDVPVPLDPAALEDREFLAHRDFIEVACWLGARLARALAHAHALGVLHRDVKPANVLLNRYGRPLLADFNVAAAHSRGTGNRLGGTLAYMAPEHLDAFNPENPTPPAAVDARSDVYSLGMVLFELVVGQPPFPYPSGLRLSAEVLDSLAGQRRQSPPRASTLAPVPEHLDRLLQRCLAPEPDRRVPSAADLAHALDGCRELHRRENTLPRGGMVTCLAGRYPFLVLAVLALVPHFLGSLVNISYNELLIITNLGPAQKEAFWRLVVGYNLVIYPLCLGLLLWMVFPIVRGWRLLSRPDPPDTERIEHTRARALRLPGWCVALSCLGWLPGGIVFPLGLSLLAPPVSGVVFGHFLLSFTISCLIALTYTLFGVQYVVVRILYPRLLGDPAGAVATAREELHGLRRRLGWFQFFAVLIPIIGAALMVCVGPGQLSPTGYGPFRLLVTALLGLGMVGLGVAVAVSGVLGETLHALTGGSSGKRKEQG
jgi:serine/threonine protein kinase